MGMDMVTGIMKMRSKFLIFQYKYHTFDIR